MSASMVCGTQGRRDVPGETRSHRSCRTRSCGWCSPTQSLRPSVATRHLCAPRDRRRLPHGPKLPPPWPSARRRARLGAVFGPKVMSASCGNSDRREWGRPRRGISMPSTSPPPDAEASRCGGNGTGAHHLVFSEKGSLALVQNWLANIEGINDGSISVVDLERMETIWQIDTLGLGTV